MYYHLVSRCVRRSYLCGRDRRTGRNYDHRKAWLEERLFDIARFFAVEVAAYAIMSNHFHLVVYFDPNASETWSAEEVAHRWLQVCPPNDGHGRVLHHLVPLQRELLLQDQERLRSCREKLGSLSTFMKFLKQPIASRANREENCTGHFFEKRFYSGALLNEDSVIAAMAYVDLNPVRAKIAASLPECENTSIRNRLKAIENTPDRLQEALKPIVSGLESVSSLSLTLGEYVERLEAVVRFPDLTTPLETGSVGRWIARVAHIRRRQRAHGDVGMLESWLAARAMRRLEEPMPTVTS